MSNRWLRFGIAFLALGAAAAAGYRIVEQEQRLNDDVVVARSIDVAAETALHTVSELKAALHAYISEGQGHAFWTARAATLIDRLRGAILDLDGPAAAAGVPLTEALDLTDRLGVAEQRARDHVRSGQRLLAGEVIFTDSRDLLDAIRMQAARARAGIAASAEARQADVRHEQALLALGAGGILAFALLLLVVPGRPVAGASLSTAGEPAGVADIRGRSSAPQAPHAPHVPRAPHAPSAPTAPGAPSPPGAPGAPSTTPWLSLREAAAVCTDLGRVSQSIEISALLQRAANVLNASGVVVWMASSAGRELYPAASAGYDERLLARIGSIPRDAANVTAGALRDAAPRTSPALGSSAAALAVPLMTPIGPVGVFSAEIRELSEVDEARMAVAAIFAAQLATLLGSMATPAIQSEPLQDNDAQPAKAQA
jgi:hypothetical protein